MKKVMRFLSVILAAVVMFTSLPLSVSAEEVKVPVNEATKFVDSLGMIWNLGNSFDPPKYSWVSNELDYETAWCKDKTTKALIEEVKKKGFSTIRITVSWHAHVDSDFKISSVWMNRVKEVVDWSIDAGLNVILDAHHDVVKGYYYPSKEEYNTSEKYMTSIWKQIAEVFKNYDNRLVFETINEPRLTGTNHEWWFNVSYPPVEVKESVDCINKLNQKALDTIRAAGGNNKDRFVLIPGSRTSIDGLVIDGFELPKDSVKDRLIVNFHDYTKIESAHKRVINQVYDKFVSKGVPAILSEFNLDHTKNEYKDDSDEYLAAWVSYAREHGISCALWDNGYNDYRIINRATLEWVEEDIADAIVKAGAPALGSADVSSDKEEDKADEESEKLTVKASQSGFYSVIKWNEIDGASKYKVYRATSKTGKKTLIKTTTSNKYTDKNTALGKKYYYFVKSYDSSTKKWSGYSDSAVLSMKKTTAATTLKGTKSGTKMKLSWSKINGAEKYYVYYSVNGGSYKKLKTVDGSKKSYTVTGLDFSKNSYKFAVRGVDDDGNKTNRSNAVSVTKK